MLLQYSENKRDMQIKRQMFSIINRKCYLCIENRKGCQNSILITKSNNQLAQCNFSDYCHIILQSIITIIIDNPSPLLNYVPVNSTNLCIYLKP